MTRTFAIICVSALLAACTPGYSGPNDGGASMRANAAAWQALEQQQRVQAPPPLVFAPMQPLPPRQTTCQWFGPRFVCQ